MEKELLEFKEAMVGYKKSQEDAFAEFKKQADVTYATPGAIAKMQEELEGKLKEVDGKLTIVNQYAEKIEEQVKAGKQLTPQQQKSFNALLGEAIEKGWSEIEKFKGKRKGEKAAFALDLYPEDTKAVGVMTITNNVQDAGAYFTTVLPGIRTLPNRKLHMRQIIPLATMTGSTLTYMREVGGEGDLAPWAVGDGTVAKEQLDRDLQEITVTAEYIAGWLRISRKMLDDMAALRSYLQMRLMEMYLKVEDAQILNGNGTSPQLEGLLSVAVTNPNNTGANIERLVRAIAHLESSDYSATGIVLHPAAYYEIALNKATGSGEYDLPGIVVIQNGQLYVAGVPVYKTTAIDASTYLVGDFELGCQLFIREQPEVRFFEEDANNVTLNLITVRIEGRVALAIYRAEAFVQGTFEGVTT
jgi:HK97 family phage major capsid protein